ncbi:hypothetical protein ABPG74_022492 [Tetrahymena malaccensis]
MYYQSQLKEFQPQNLEPQQNNISQNQVNTSRLSDCKCHYIDDIFECFSDCLKAFKSMCTPNQEHQIQQSRGCDLCVFGEDSGYYGYDFSCNECDNGCYGCDCHGCYQGCDCHGCCQGCDCHGCDCHGCDCHCV